MSKEEIIAAIHARKAIYETKREASDRMAEDSYTRFDLFNHAVEAFELLLSDIKE